LHAAGIATLQCDKFDWTGQRACYEVAEIVELARSSRVRLRASVSAPRIPLPV
jgi:hypothetical protein